MALAVLAIMAVCTMPSVVETLNTYRRRMAAQHVLAEIRAAQSIAVTRGGVYGLQWGAGASHSPGEYRVIRDATGDCDLPSANAPQDGLDVVRGWRDLSDDYPRVVIQSIEDASGRPVEAVMFDAVGASTNPCEPVSFPVVVAISDGAGGTATIQVRRSGLARIS
jgi:hypothetical protein